MKYFLSILLLSVALQAQSFKVNALRASRCASANIHSGQSRIR